MVMKKVKLSSEYGEVYCDRCEGTGEIDIKNYKSVTRYFKRNYKQICPKCNGKGKLDWIENVMGKKKEYSDFDDEMSFNYQKQFLNRASEHLAIKIDKQILSSIFDDLEHNTKSMEELKLNDNRIFSEYMLQSFTEQKIEDKED